jgi:branched-chain amino acid transport system ATP-binding protein
MTLLALSNVTKRFGGLVAVDDVSVAVPGQGVTAVIGPNGAGKTTLFNVISGFAAPDRGRVVFGGVDITGLAPERIAAQGLARTFQLVQLFGALSALENVKVGCHLHTRGGLAAAILRLPRTRRGESEVEAEARRLLDFVGLADSAAVPAASLPYGQQRLLEIARALATRPRLLLLDEPAAGLNAGETARLSETIRKIAAGGAKVLLIEHDMKLVMNTADRIVVLDFGRKIAEGPPEEVRRDPAVVAAYLGVSGARRA